MSDDLPEEVPFSFPVDVVQLPPAGRDYKITASESDRAAIASHLGVEAVGRFVANVTLLPRAGGVEARGRLDADVVQACVVTLQPLPVTVSVDLERLFAGVRKKAAVDPPAIGWVDPNDEFAEPVVDGTVDLGAVVVEELGLALDPYPRAPGASFPGAQAAPEAPSKDNPFAALAKLKAPPAPRRTPGAKGKTPRK